MGCRTVKKKRTPISSAQKTAEMHQQCRHGRMVEIAPGESSREHVIIGFVIGQLGAPRLDEVYDPPKAETQPHQSFGVLDLLQRSHVSVRFVCKDNKKQPRRAAVSENLPDTAVRTGNPR